MAFKLEAVRTPSPPGGAGGEGRGEEVPFPIRPSLQLSPRSFLSGREGPLQPGRCFLQGRWKPVLPWRCFRSLKTRRLARPAPLEVHEQVLRHHRKGELLPHRAVSGSLCQRETPGHHRRDGFDLQHRQAASGTEPRSRSEGHEGLGVVRTPGVLCAGQPAFRPELRRAAEVRVLQGRVHRHQHGFEEVGRVFDVSSTNWAIILC